MSEEDKLSISLDKYLKKYYKSGLFRQSIVYILTNEDKTHYYVGTTKKTVDERYHMFGPNRFQREYEINKLYKIYQVPDTYYAYQFELIVFMLMRDIVGENNVRGAFLTMYELPSKREITILKKCHIKNLCYKCQGDDHYARNCFN